MTTTTAPNRSTAHVPTANLQRATTPSIDEPGLVDHLAGAAGEALVNSISDLAVPLPIASALDAYESMENGLAALDVLRENTAASSLGVNETASTETTLRVEPTKGVYVDVKGTVEVSKKPDRYEVVTSLEAAGGLKLESGKASEAKDAKPSKLPHLEGEAGGVIGVTVTHNVKTAAEADAKIHAYKESAQDGLTNPTRMVWGNPKGTGLLGAVLSREETYADAASVKTQLEAKGNVTAALWKDDAGADEVATALGLKLEGRHALAMDVKKGDDGTMSVTFTETVTLASELELGHEHSPLEELTVELASLAQNSEVTVSKSLTLPLPADFDQRKSSNPAAVLAAAQRAGAKEDVTVEVKTHLGGQDIEATVKVDGDFGDAMTVAAAYMGKGDATGIAVAGEVKRSAPVQRPATMSVGVGPVGVEVATEHTRELESVSVTDVSTFVKELGKTSAKALLDLPRTIGR